MRRRLALFDLCGTLKQDGAGVESFVHEHRRDACLALAARDLPRVRDATLFLAAEPELAWRLLALSLLATLGAFNKEQMTSLANLSRWAFLLTFAGVGLMTDFREMRKQGLRPFIVGALGEVAIAILTLGMVIGVDAVFVL